MKLKTKSSAKKRFRFTATGLVKAGQCGKRHNMRKRGHRMLRNARGMTILDQCDAKKIASTYFHV
ncbi:MAG: 50S ribosomal protein L35 [Holosporales bacterium]|jgi:large subunit ribosomal protein L35|nr:50S ribosomal protein L35 [Holosporales bacterium]